MLSVGPEPAPVSLPTAAINETRGKNQSVQPEMLTFYILLSTKFAINKESRLFPGLMYLTVKVTWLPLA